MKPALGLLTFFALIGLNLLSSSSSFAQSKRLQNLTTLQKKEAASPWNLAAELSKARNLYDFQDGTLQESTDLAVIPSYRSAYGVSQLVLSYSKDDRYAENSDMGDVIFSQNLKPWNFSRFLLAPRFSVTAPQSKISKELRNLETALSAGLTATVKPEFLKPGFMFRGGLTIGRNFHRYETAVNGMTNTQYSFRQTLSGMYTYKLLSFSMDVGHLSAWTYSGAVRESFEHSEEVACALGDHYSVALGHTNQGSVLKANGYDSNVQWIDEKSSVIYAKLSLQY